MIMTELVAGIDGGGTRTRAALATPAGELLGVGEAGSGNLHDVGPQGFGDNLNLALERARDSAGAPRGRLGSIFLGLGSVVTEADRAAIREVVSRQPWSPNGCIGVDHDLRIAHQGCLGGASGVVLIAGTGSSAYGRNERGESWKSGGWGPLLDDVGSGHWLGRQAMIAAIRESDGRGRPTSMTRAVLEWLNVDDCLEILRRVELEGMSRSEVAAMGRLVIEAASQGDEVAIQSMEHGAAALAEIVAAVAERLDMADAPTYVSPTGGLVDAGSTFLDPLQRALARRLPSARLTPGKAAPVIGAVMLAIELLTGAPLTDDTAARLAPLAATA
jgi:N-acetylglucosamine kinase-like BadF-type ATPase